MTDLHLVLREEDPAFQRALARSKTGARGHIGTHFDCYTTPPESDHFSLPALILDCTGGMPGLDACKALPSLAGKALILRTANEETNGYASPAYFAKETFLPEHCLIEILDRKPAFIVIDSHGIGPSGEIHTRRDKICEAYGCHVIENANLAPLAGKRETQLEIFVDVNNPSTGKPCKLICP